MTALDDFVMTKHALERMQDMLVTPDEVRRAMLEPTKIHRAPKNSKYPHVQWYDRDRITLAVSTKDSRDRKKAVLTVLWRSAGLWKRDIELHGEYEGRGERW